MKRFIPIIAALFLLIPSQAMAKSHRVCSDPAPGFAACQARVQTARKPQPPSNPTGYGPAQFRSAYNLPSSSANPQLVAVVVAYDAPTLENDLAVYSNYFGLPACTHQTGCFRKVNQTGGSRLPTKNAGWALEASMDVEVIHAVCPNCRILVVEGSSASVSNLAQAVDTAVSMGATVVNNSYGAGEFSSEMSFASSYNHPGVAITVSSGDSGYGSSYPSNFNTVVSVGGTTLNLGAGNTYLSETAWNGAGSGCSLYAFAPAWQTALSNWGATGCGSARAISDVSADADPATGAAVYDSTTYQSRSGWWQVGGTSLSAPIVAGVYGLAGDFSGYPASQAYANASALHDVTSGSNGSCGTIICDAGVGFDGPTGLGTPNGLTAF